MYVPKEVEIRYLGTSRVCVSGQDFIFAVIRKTKLEYKGFWGVVCFFCPFFPEFTILALKTGKVSVQLKNNGDDIANSEDNQWSGMYLLGLDFKRLLLIFSCY